MDHLGGVGDILQVDIGRHQEVDDDAAGAVDGGFQQRRGDGHPGGLLGLIGAAGLSQAHMGVAGILHDGGDVGKVQIDDAGDIDEVGDALHRLQQHLIRLGKGVG